MVKGDIETISSMPPFKLCRPWDSTSLFTILALSYQFLLDFFDFPFSVCNLNTMTCETVPYLIIFAGTNSDVP